MTLSQTACLKRDGVVRLPDVAILKLKVDVRGIEARTP